jgi:hypothetical protein
LVSHLAIIQAGFRSDPPAARIHIAAISGSLGLRRRRAVVSQ